MNIEGPLSCQFLRDLLPLCLKYKNCWSWSLLGLQAHVIKLSPPPVSLSCINLIFGPPWKNLAGQSQPEQAREQGIITILILHLRQREIEPFAQGHIAVRTEPGFTHCALHLSHFLS